MRSDVLSIYDRSLRQDPPCPGSDYRIERSERITRLIGPTPAAHDNCILYSRLDSMNTDAAIDAELARFASDGRNVEWKVYGHDEPCDLAERLLLHGFTAQAAETVVVRESSGILDAHLTDRAVLLRHLRAVGELGAVLAVEDAVWNESHGWLVDSLARELTDGTDRLEILVAEAQGQPVACSWMRCHDGTEFASLWGAATLPEFRGRGLYSALVARHAATARARGLRFLTADVNDQSRPVLARLGFSALTSVRGHVSPSVD